MALYKIFEATIPSNVVTHFNQNWLGIRKDWTQYSMLKSFGNTTDNRNEGVHSRIKHFLELESPIKDFFEDLFTFIESQNFEQDRKAINMFAERPNFNMDDDESEYYKALTKWAFDKVMDEKYKIATVHFRITTQSKWEIAIKPASSSKKFNLKIFYLTSLLDCTCFFKKSTGLPCKHILKF